MSGFAGAVSLLTRIPVRARDAGPDSLAGAVPWFPIVGAFVGALVALVFVAASMILPGVVAAVLAVAGSALVTGAFHEDGLGDVADAFAGGYTVERRLEILQDPRHGTFGVLAISSAFLLRVVAIGSLDVWSALALVPAAHAISRGAAIALMRRVPVASPSGLGAGYVSSLTARGEALGLVSAVGIGALLIGAWALAAVVLCALVAAGMGALAKAKIGGIGGDVLGATQQVAEITVLLMGVAVLHEGWGVLAWWAP
jgi:adenosylcobinamide-GDP ribazoletransferase